MAPWYTMMLYMDDGKILHEQTSSLGSKCHSVGDEGRQVERILFTGGWIEEHFTIYKDHKCEQGLYTGSDGSYITVGMNIGSWSVD